MDRVQRRRRSFQRAPLTAKRARVTAPLAPILEVRPSEVVPPTAPVIGAQSHGGAPLSTTTAPEVPPQGVASVPVTAVEANPSSDMAPIIETTDRVESFVEMMIENMGNLPPLSPERGGLQRTEEEQGDQTYSSPPRGPGRGVVLSDEEDVQVLSPKTAHRDPSFDGGAHFDVPESSAKDGSNFFRPGYTIPPLCPGALEEARREGTSSTPLAFSYYMSQVCLF